MNHSKLSMDINLNIQMQDLMKISVIEKSNKRGNQWS